MPGFDPADYECCFQMYLGGETSAPRQAKSPVPWWTDKCSEVTRDKKRALKRLKRSSLPGDYIDNKNAGAITRKTIKEAKRKGWQEFCANIDSKTSTRDIWNKQTPTRPMSELKKDEKKKKKKET